MDRLLGWVWFVLLDVGKLVGPNRVHLKVFGWNAKEAWMSMGAGRGDGRRSLPKKRHRFPPSEISLIRPFWSTTTERMRMRMRRRGGRVPGRSI